MKKKIYIPVVIAFFSGIIIFTCSTGSTIKQSIHYIDNAEIQSCTAICHKGNNYGRRYEIGQISKHSKAYINLLTSEADQIAKNTGFCTSAAETPLCIKCHILYKEMDTEVLYDNYDKFHGIK